MKNNNSKAVREGAMMIALTAVLVLLTWYVPLFSFVGMFVCGVPMACMAARNDTRFTVVALVGVLVITFLVTMSLPSAVSIMLMTILPGAVAGWCMGKKINFFSSLFATCLTVCVGWLVMVFLIDSLMQGQNVESMMNEMLGQFEQIFDASVASMPQEILEQSEISTAVHAMTETMKAVFRLYFPALVVIGSMMIGYVIHVLCGFFIKRLKLAEINTVPFSQLKAPRGMCFLAVVLYFVSMLSNGKSVFGAVCANVVMILYTIIGICGLSMVDFFFARVVKKGALRALIYFAVFMFGSILMGILSSAMIMAGIIDSSYNFRRISTDEADFDGGDGGRWV